MMSIIPAFLAAAPFLAVAAVFLPIEIVRAIRAAGR